MNKESFPYDPIEGDKEPIQGDGFTVKRTPPNFRDPTAWEPKEGAEFRPGSTSGTVKPETGRERTDEDLEKMDLSALAEHVVEMVKRDGEYSEKISINTDGTLNHKEKAGGSTDTKTPFASVFTKTPEDLYRKMHAVAEQHPGIDLSFTRDPEGKWIEYKVSKKP